MSETVRLGLPLVQPSQAQKHVTVNEALLRLDSLQHLSFVSRGVTDPPASVVEGAVYLVPPGATGSWSSKSGQIALGLSMGWDFVEPQAGWRGFVLDEGIEVIFDGSDWTGTLLRRSPSGATTRFEILEFDHSLSAGSTNATAISIPSGSMVCAASARVLSDITGTALNWSLGIAGSAGQFGTGLGLSTGSYAEGVLGTPTTYYTDTPLLLTAGQGDFAGGSVRFAIHHLRFGLPGL